MSCFTIEIDCFKVSSSVNSNRSPTIKSSNNNHYRRTLNNNNNNTTKKNKRSDDSKLMIESDCNSMRLRKEWRRLERSERANYIRSVKCLAERPSRLLGKGYRRWDDFQFVHCQKLPLIHGVPIFLPWHRHFIYLYEKSLREECNYSGPIPYWDWTLDSKNFTQSPIWSPDPIIGFGSNGTLFGEDPEHLGGGIVTDGAFAKFKLYYPNKNLKLMRNFGLPEDLIDPDHYLGSQWYNSEIVKSILEEKEISNFQIKLEGNYLLPSGERLPGPHSIMHTLIGGDMPILRFSANDPVFYPHHYQVDRVWTIWQESDPKKRQYFLQDIQGHKANLDDELDYLNLGPRIKVRQSMNTKVQPYCYTYQ